MLIALMMRPAHPATNSGCTIAESDANSWPPNAACPSAPASSDSLQTDDRREGAVGG